jgi:hypothetical protein
MAKTVGRFTLDDDGGLSGPKEYMEEQGNAKLDAILDGKDAIFLATAHLSPDMETAILVALQTDYAGWKGVRDFTAGIAKPKVAP